MQTICQYLHRNRVFQLIDRLTRHASVPILNRAQLHELIAPLGTVFPTALDWFPRSTFEPNAGSGFDEKKCESSMLRRKLVLPTLVCYGLIAVFGQGLHLWLAHDDELFCNDHEQVACDQLGSPQGAVRSSDQYRHGHNEQECSICQHHSLGQFFVAESPSAIAIVECGFTTVLMRESANCPTHHSPSQPRAPPLA